MFEQLLELTNGGEVNNGERGKNNEEVVIRTEGARASRCCMRLSLCVHVSSVMFVFMTH